MWNFYKIRQDKLHMTGQYLLSVVEIVNNVQQIENGALLIVNYYALGLIWGIDSIYLLTRTVKIRMAF